MEIGYKIGRRTHLGFAIVPFDTQCVAPSLRGERRLGKHGNARLDGEHMPDALYLQGIRCIEPHEFSAETGTMSDHRDEQVRTLDVLRIDLRPAALGKAVLSPHALGADQPIVLTPFQ